MEYGKIISITGMGGLYELVGSKKDGAIVRSLDDKTTKFVSSRIHNFSHLESIEIYTTGDNINLVDLLKAMDASNKALPADKDAAAVKAYFEEVYPELDFDRVYASDMRKMVKWFSVLKANHVDFKLTEVEEAEPETTEADAATAPVAETTKADNTSSETSGEAKTKTKPTAAIADNGEEEAAEAPKKKAPRKKKTEE